MGTAEGGSKTFRVFVSSTFTDMAVERNTLAVAVFPAVRSFCARRGLRFQAVDLRWGIRDEAVRDHQTMRICLEEISRCQATAKRPNFLALMGHRYGWRPLPSEIHCDHFDAIHERADKNGRLLLEEWYQLDENFVPPQRYLVSVPRSLAIWPEIESKLRTLIDEGVVQQDLAERQRTRYTASATEQEVFAGILELAESGGAACCFRQIDNAGEILANPRSQREVCASYLDLASDLGVVEVARRRQAELVSRVERCLGGRFYRYHSHWNGRAPTESTARRIQSAIEELGARIDRIGSQVTWVDLLAERAGWLDVAGRSMVEDHRHGPLTMTHLGCLCADVYIWLVGEILAESGSLCPGSSGEGESDLHVAFGQDRIRSRCGSSNFVGRDELRRAVVAYVSSHERQLLAVFGESGSGKTALLACCADDARSAHCEAVVLVRHVGATPTASQGKTLLRELCADVQRHYGVATGAPEDYRSLSSHFAQQLALATPARPLIIFIDALDQLPETDEVRTLQWLPAVLPLNVRLIVSCLSDELGDQLRRKTSSACSITVGPMPREEAARLLSCWLSDSGRTLQIHQFEQVLTAFESTGSPLYLKLAFEKARHWRFVRHRSLSRDTGEALSSSIHGLLDELFDYLSLDSNHGSVLVRHGLGYLAAARYGLSEDELVDILSRDREIYADFQRLSHHTPPDQRLPLVIWSRLNYELKPYLMKRLTNGTEVLTYYHRSVREAARLRFLPQKEGRARHRALAAYFRHQYRLGAEGSQQRLRTLAELSYQMTNAHLWRGVGRFLLDLEFIQAKVAAGMPFDQLEDYERALAALPGADPVGIGTQIGPAVSTLAMAFRQELHTFTNSPERTAQQLHNNLVGHFAGRIANLGPLVRGLRCAEPADEALVRWIAVVLRHFAARSKESGVRWLRRLNPAPRTLLPTELQRRVLAHADALVALAPSPDGARLATAGRDGTVRIWRAPSGYLEAELRHEASPVAVCWPRGLGDRRIITGWGNNISIWDWPEEREIHRWLAQHNCLRGLAVLGADLLASCGDDRAVRLWSLPDGMPQRALHGHRGRVTCLAADPHTGLLLSGGEDLAVRVWRSADGKQLGAFRGHTARPRCLALVAELGAFSCGDDGVLWQWVPPDCVSVRAFRGHRGSARALVVTGSDAMQSPDEPSWAYSLISVGDDRTLRLWPQPGLGTGGETAPDAPSTSRIAPEPIRYALQAPHAVLTMTVDPRCQWLATGGDDGSLAFWSPPSDRKQIVVLPEHAASITSVRVARDLTTTTSRDGTAIVWRGTNASYHLTFRDHLAPVTASARVDVERMLTGDSDGGVRLWSVQSGELAHDFGTALPSAAFGDAHERIRNSHRAPVAGIFRIDGSTAVSAATDGELAIWDTRVGRLVHRMASGMQGLDKVALVRGGGFVVLAYRGEPVKAWRVASGEIFPLSGLVPATPHAVTVARTGRVFCVSSDRVASYWDVSRLSAGRQCAGTVAGEVRALTTDPAGDHLVWLSQDSVGQVRIPVTEPPVVVPHDLQGAFAITFHPSGKLVGTATTTGEIALWTFPGLSPVTRAVVDSAISVLAIDDGRVIVGTERGGLAVFSVEGPLDV